MNFELDTAADARRNRAGQTARTLATVSASFDAGAPLDDDTRRALRAVLPAQPEDARVDWVAAIEEVAAVSPALALVAAADVLGLPALAASRWHGCRGVDLDALGRVGTTGVWHLAVSATLVGGARAAVEAAVGALRQAKAAGHQTPAAHPAVADAATAVDASRLLLWDAAHQAAGAREAAARYQARLHALGSVELAIRALAPAVGPDAFRIGTPLDRVRRDLDSLALVLGEASVAREAVAVERNAPRG